MSALLIISTDARKKLLFVAEKLFAEQGFSVTSIRQIATEANLNLSMISYYFGSKQGLYEEIFVTRLDELNENLQNISWRARSSQDKLNQFLKTHIDMYKFNSSFLRLLYREFTLLSHSVIKEMITSYLKENYQILETIVNDGAKSGLFKMVNPSLFYLTIFSLVPMIVNGSPFYGANETGEAGSNSTADLDYLKNYLHQIIMN